MRILLVNSRYFIRGGPDRYLFKVTELLQSRGHNVIPFSTRHPRNEPSPYDTYFVSGVGGDAEIFAEVTKTPRTVAKMLSRTVYSSEVRRALERLIAATSPDVALLINYKKKLSPSVIDACARASVPVIVRLTDFTRICPQGTFLRDGTLCELCLGRSKIPSVRYRCVKGSLGASVVNYVAEGVHAGLGIDGRVDLFVTPSEFARTKFIEAGLAGERIALLPQLIEVVAETAPLADAGNYILYFGRVAFDKGLDRLVRAYAVLSRRRPTLGVRLRIAGPDQDGEHLRLTRLVNELELAGVDLSGSLDEASLTEAIRGCLFAVTPSRWYDVIPNSILEAYACSKPVIASDLGSLREVVRHGQTGLLCDTQDAEQFADAMEDLLDQPELRKAMGVEARRWIQEAFSPTVHYDTLMGLFGSVGASTT